MASRREHQCKACDSEAEFEVHLLVRTIKPKMGESIEFNCASTLKCCNNHRQKMADVLLHQSNRDMMEKTVAEENMAPLDWATAKVEYKPIPKGPPIVAITAGQVIPRCDLGDEDAQCVLPAKYQIALRVFRFGSKKDKADMLTNVCVCEAHRRGLTTKHVLVDKVKSDLLVALTNRGFPMPDFARTEMTFHVMTGGRKIDPAQFERGAA
jgi:hypothetical protein